MSQAQNSYSYRPLKVGDKLPNYVLKNLINYPTKNANFNDFQGKILILDFWNTSCASCIELWPKLEKLQAQFRNEMQILLLNPWQEESVISTFIKKRRDLNIIDLTLPTACKDSILLDLFPVKTVPHIIWVDKSGILRFITSSDVLNVGNIERMLNNEDISMYQKNDLKIQVDFRKPLYTPDPIIEPATVMWQSTLAAYDDFLGATLGQYSDESMGYVIFMINHPIIDLFRFAYSDRLNGDNYLSRVQLNRVILDVKDSIKYRGVEDGQVQYKHLYSYQALSRTPVSRTDLQLIMQQDLARYFPLSARWEKRKLKCLVLTMSDSSKINYKGGSFKFVISDTEFNVNKIKLDYVLKYLEDATPYYYSPYPIINETKFEGKLGKIQFTTNVYDHMELDKALRKYGMRLNLEERDVDILVITDKLKK